MYNVFSLNYPVTCLKNLKSAEYDSVLQPNSFPPSTWLLLQLNEIEIREDRITEEKVIALQLVMYEIMINLYRNLIHVLNILQKLLSFLECVNYYKFYLFDNIFTALRYIYHTKIKKPTQKLRQWFNFLVQRLYCFRIIHRII